MRMYHHHMNHRVEIQRIDSSITERLLHRANAQLLIGLLYARACISSVEVFKHMASADISLCHDFINKIFTVGMVRTSTLCHKKYVHRAHIAIHKRISRTLGEYLH